MFEITKTQLEDAVLAVLQYKAGMVLDGSYRTHPHLYDSLNKTYKELTEILEGN